VSTPRLIGTGVELLCLYGNCPVQAEGFIDTAPFYFRARGARWAIEIGRGNTTLVVDAMLEANPRTDGAGWEMFGGDRATQDAARKAQEALECWRYEEPYGTWPDAGWISDEEAIAFILKGAELYRAAVRATGATPATQSSVPDAEAGAAKQAAARLKPPASE
jgi:hypothetical protein